MRPIIHPQQHAFDALKLMSGMQLTLIPVLDDKDNYIGSVTQKSVMDKLAGFSSVMEQGGIIELERRQKLNRRRPNAAGKWRSRPCKHALGIVPQLSRSMRELAGDLRAPAGEPALL